ncbi:MAG: Ran GTPase binding protein, partial [Amphiamblys sp. WSBS2006]
LKQRWQGMKAGLFWKEELYCDRLVNVDPAGHGIPQKWNIHDKSEFLVVSDNSTTLGYSPDAGEELVAGMARSRFSVPREIGLFYYEITVLDVGVGRNIGVGFSAGAVSLNKLPGWEGASFGYHGDDGMVYGGGDGIGQEYGPVFEKDDVIGCGIDFIQRNIFFTRNGVFLGTAFSGFPADTRYYPAVGLRTHGEKINVNFGQNMYVFGIDEHIDSVLDGICSEIESTPWVCEEDVEKLVDEHLLRNGCGETLTRVSARRKELERRNSSHIDNSLVKVFKQKEVVSELQGGSIDRALERFLANYPQLATSAIVFVFYQQKFLETLREYLEARPKEKDGLLKRVFLEGGKIRGLFQKDTEMQDEIQKTLSLLAYDDPFSCPHHQLLSPTRREKTCDIVQHAILKHEGFGKYSSIEYVVQHEEALFSCLVYRSSYILNIVNKGFLF